MITYDLRFETTVTYIDHLSYLQICYALPYMMFKMFLFCFVFRLSYTAKQKDISCARENTIYVTKSSCL